LRIKRPVYTKIRHQKKGRGVEEKYSSSNKGLYAFRGLKKGRNLGGGAKIKGSGEGR